MKNRLLLVNNKQDDNLLEYLRRSGYEVEFSTPDEVVQSCTALFPQLILLLDIEVCDNLKEILENVHIKHIPAIHASTGTGYDIVEEGEYTPDMLTKLIQKLNIYKSLVNMKLISDKLSNIIEKSY